MLVLPSTAWGPPNQWNKDTTIINTHEEFNLTVIMQYNFGYSTRWQKTDSTFSITVYSLFLASWWMDWLYIDDFRMCFICMKICGKWKKNCPLYKCPELQIEHCEGTSKLLLVSKAFWLLCLWSEGMLPPEHEFKIHM